MKSKIVMIGSANVDYIMQVPKLPALGETVTGGTFFQTFGGKGANQAVAAARAGGDVTMVAALGGDATARTYFESLKHNGIHMEHVTMETDVPGGSALVMFDERGENYLTVAPGANLCVTPERVRAAEALIASSDWIILQQEIPLESNQLALELAAKHGTPVLLNYAPATDLRLKLDGAVHGLVVNEIEAAAVAGLPTASVDQKTAHEVAKDLRHKGGHRFVIVTLGKDGSVFAEKTETHHIPSFGLPAVDTTAAGDTFCGTLTVALGEGQNLRDAVRFASAAASLAVTKIGAQSSIPIRSEMEALLRA
jgi:ribokinase